MFQAMDKILIFTILFCLFYIKIMISQLNIFVCACACVQLNL